jgi:hypothetical protein
MPNHRRPPPPPQRPATDGHSFSLRWSRAGRQIGSVGGLAHDDDDRVTFFYRHRGGMGGEWEDVKEKVALEQTECNFGGEALVSLPRSGVRPEGRRPLWAWEILPV